MPKLNEHIYTSHTQTYEFAYIAINNGTKTNKILDKLT